VSGPGSFVSHRRLSRGRGSADHDRPVWHDWLQDPLRAGCGCGADRIVAGMGPVLTKAGTDFDVPLGGNPGVVLRQLPADTTYFNRSVGWSSGFTQPPAGIEQAVR
jgi:hypothetical protein